MVDACTSCGTNVSAEYTKFTCPQCGKSEFIRCPQCRILAAKYSCGQCGFTGP